MNTPILRQTGSTFLFLMSSLLLFSQAPTGQWKTIDDKTGIEKSIVTIVEKDQKLYGFISELLEEEYANQDPLCENCKGDKKNQPVKGLEIIWDMEQSGKNSWTGGKIMDPEDGKIYGCKISLSEDNKLKVRGFVGFAAMGRNQYWYRVQ